MDNAIVNAQRLVLICVLILCGCTDDPPRVAKSVSADVSQDISSAPEVTIDIVAPETTTLPGEFGAPCKENIECNSGFCINGPSYKICTQICASSCPDPEKFICKQASAQDPYFLCISKYTEEVCDGADNDGDSMTDEGFCDDGKTCTIDSCDSTGACLHTERPGEPCNDGSVCTQEDLCFGGTCTGSLPKVCIDGNVCTTDNICDPIGGCTFPFNSESCDDGNPCTIQDTCKDGSCTLTKPRVCNDENPCTSDSCIPTFGGCVFAPVPDGIAPIGVNGCAPTLPFCKKGVCSPTP